MSTINASVYRNTRFEIRTIEQEANGFRLVCSPRNVAPHVVVLENGQRVLRAERTPPLEVHEKDFTDDEMRQVHALFEMLENKFAAVHSQWEADPARNRELVAAAVEAERRIKSARLEAARIEAENIAKRAEAEELDLNLAAMRAAARAATNEPAPVTEREFPPVEP